MSVVCSSYFWFFLLMLMLTFDAIILSLNSCSSIASIVYIKQFSHKVYLREKTTEFILSIAIKLHFNFKCTIFVDNSPELSTSIKWRIFELMTNFAHTNYYRLTVQNHELLNYVNAIDVEALHLYSVQLFQLFAIVVEWKNHD